MSNDYALFIIIIPNDFELATSVVPSTTIADGTRQEPTTASDHRLPADISLSVPTSIIPLTEKDDEPDILPIQQQSMSLSICVLLKNYLSERSDLEALWMMCDNNKKCQVTFYVQFGLASDRMLQDLAKMSIGKRYGTRVSVLPTTIVLKGQHHDENESLSSSWNSKQDINTASGDQATSFNEKFHRNEENGGSSHDHTLSDKIRRRIHKSDFRKSVQARLMVHQVVASIRASSAISFDFVLLICLASMLAAFGLLENSTVIIVASMLVSPLMNPILGFVFGLSVRDHSLWRRGLRNEIIGLIICLSCGFLLGLLTTFYETKWGSSSSFPTVEMRSRGDVKRLWVGVLIALPSGAGVALSVLGGNTGSLVGVAISASLLPPAVNCGLLFAYGLFGKIFPGVAATQLSTLNITNRGFFPPINCPKYINNDYQPLYTCNLSTEAIILAGCSLLLTIVNIICIVIMALIILRIKEVVPLNQANKHIANFFHHDVKVARDYNKTIQANDFSGVDLTAATLRGNHIAQSIVNRWKAFKSPVQQEQQQSSKSMNTDLEAANYINQRFPNDIESRRKLFRLKTFANEYDLDIFNDADCNLTSSDSQEKVLLLVGDLIDMCQEIPSVFIDLYRLQPSGTESSANDKEHILFYHEIIEYLPPKWYQLFKYERQRRYITSSSVPYDRSYPMRQRPLQTYENPLTISSDSHFHGSLKKRNKKNRVRLFRQSSVPESSIHPTIITPPYVDTPIEGTRFRIAKATTTTSTEISDNE